MSLTLNWVEWLNDWIIEKWYYSKITHWVSGRARTIRSTRIYLLFLILNSWSHFFQFYLGFVAVSVLDLFDMGLFSIIYPFICYLKGKKKKKALFWLYNVVSVCSSFMPSICWYRLLGERVCWNRVLYKLVVKIVLVLWINIALPNSFICLEIVFFMKLHFKYTPNNHKSSVKKKKHKSR